MPSGDRHRRQSAELAVAHVGRCSTLSCRGIAWKIGQAARPDEEELQTLGALWTAREIAQQPAMPRKTHTALVAGKDAGTLLSPIAESAATRVILTGAGTSAFIGECLAPYLAAGCGAGSRRSTTDLVCAPYLYFEAGTPTLLVSFGRSGNSPESVAALDLAEQFVGGIHHLAITCNPDGALARRIAAAGNGMAILLPEETHDRSFAMTSSFSCMTYAALAVLSGIDGMEARVEHVAQAVEAVIAAQADAMKTLAGRQYERVVYLGSHIFKGLAREAALKLLELTDGDMIAVYDSPLGFRHGPKTIVNDKTLVVIFLSNDAYTRRYDVDLLEEIRATASTAVCSRSVAGMKACLAGVERILIPAMGDAEVVDLLIPFIAVPQMFAFEGSISRGLSPDKPNTSGTVNRVVQGVRIHAVR
jgi:tagatose-6-phosphate ketose/aldose isomerase